ncbi:DASS family sodium-coupled anion symporter [Polaromonas sp.]|uniref:DASS family sodium-coupled anion symporter n=1 Tax=Polaromonas sp. TaxID=1869339 RepID=UPI001D555945|nr:DASS family sodium-coupled anion symporter [Polaromonas sp.]MBT9475927.1 SLC13/DASS family transporter [Polaromonas sp.]
MNLQWGALPRTLASLALAALVYAAAPPPDALRAGLALFVLIGSLWMTQALPLSISALMVPLLAVLTGLMGVREALAPFAHPIIFLFLGGFALAAALQRHGLDRALALAVLRLAGGHRVRAVLLLFGLTALLSMWISNTACAAMMLPLARGLLQDGEAADSPMGTREKSFVLLGLAYSANIGGMGTLVGSPPNAIAAAQAGIGFAQWLAFGVPLVALLLPLMIGVLYLTLRPRLRGRITVTREALVWTRERRTTMAVFALTAAAWVASAPIGKMLDIDADIDSLIALAALIALVASGTLRWPEVEQGTQWGVLLLFGGGLALSEVMRASGASQFLAGQLLALLQGAPVLLVLLGMVTFVVFLTELVSNTASAALLIPIFLGVASALGLPPQLLAAAIAAAASCAFMLPVATPPNAIVFATEQVSQGTMMRCGLALNLVSIAVISALATAVQW